MRSLALILAVFALVNASGPSSSTTSHAMPDPEQPDATGPRFLTTQATPPHPDHAYLAAIQQWRAKRTASLTAPDGWFSLVALEWLKPGVITVGASVDNTVRLAHGPAHLAVLRTEGETVHLAAPPDGFAAGTTLDGSPATEAVLSYDEGHPSVLRGGSLLLIVIKRGDRLYLRVKDTTSQERSGFHGLNWYPVRPEYRIAARWIPAGGAASLVVPNILGQMSHEPSPGMAEFTLYGQTVRLFPIVEGPGTLFFIFRDATSKADSYGAGRFLYTELPSNGIGRHGTLVLDFNKAENPPCAYTAFATCPLAPQQNRLTIPIPAGERRYRAED